MTTIVAWNVNSIRARLEIVTNYLREASPDIVLFQETKCMDEQFPREPFEELGYNIELHGQKSYNGVAILSKSPIEDVFRGFDAEEARYIEGFTMGLYVASIYVPNGQAIDAPKYHYKLQFYDTLYQRLERRLETPMIIGGDYNVALHDEDVYDLRAMKDHICFSIPERQKLNALLNQGWIDSTRITTPRGERAYTWWDYRAGSFPKNNGLRIDYMLMSPTLIKRHKKTWVDIEPRKIEKTSDHAPIWIELEHIDKQIA